MVVFLVCCGVAMGLSGDYCFRTSAFPSYRLLCGFVLYTLSGVPVWMVYQRSAFMYVALLWSVLALGVSAWIGSVLLHEPLTARQWAAFVLAVAAVILWNSGDDPLPVARLAASGGLE